MRLALIAPLALLSACSVSSPVVGIMEPGIPMQGEAVASTSGAGRFTVRNLDGLVCSGPYDAADMQPTIEMEIFCSDGRKGRVLATRSASMTAGTATAKLDDGTRGRFVFGDVDPATRAAMLTID